MAKQKKAQEVSAVRQAKHGWIITLLFTVLSVLWISPIFMVLLNSFKRKAYIFKHPFVSVRNVQIVIVGISIGRITLFKSCHLLAPSIFAASISSPGIF